MKRLVPSFLATILVLGLALSPTKALGDIDDFLIASYSFSQDSVTVQDDSGNGNDGENIGAIWTPNGVIGGAYVFQSGASIDLPYLMNSNQANAHSVSLCYRFSNAPSGYATLIGQAISSENNNLYLLISNDGAIRNANKSYAWLPSGWNDGNWHHIVYSHPAGGTKLDDRFYYDGQLLLTFAGIGDWSEQSTDWKIGIDAWGNNPFEGTLDEVRVYNSDLTETDVGSLYNLYFIPPPCQDSDGDGYNSAECGGDDCDDTDSSIFPGAVELCDGKDNDCDGEIDEECPVGVTVWKDGKVAAASWSIDDADPSCRDVLEASGFRGTYYLSGDGFGSFWQDYAEAGHEVSCHTSSHPCNVTWDSVYRYRTEQIEPNIYEIESITGKPALTFAYPCGCVDDTRREAVSYYFLGSRGYADFVCERWHVQGLEDTTPQDFQELHCFDEYEQSYVDQAIVEGKWAIIVSHGDCSGVDYMGSRADELYLAPVGDVLKYIKVRDSAVFTNYSRTDEAISFQATHTLETFTRESLLGYNFLPIEFDNEVTVWVELGNGDQVHWVSVDGVATPYVLTTYEGKSVVLVNMRLDTTRQVVVALTATAPTIPVAVDDHYSVIRDSVLTVAAPGVLGNDSDADGDPIAAVLVGGVGHGTLVLNPDGSFTYTPEAGYSGTDSFTYQASDGQNESNTATVTISVLGITATFGLDTGDASYVESAGVVNVMCFQNTAGDGILTGLELLGDDARGGGVAMFVYADNNGSPGSLLLDAGTATVTDGWIVISGLSFNVTNNTWYWLGFNLQNKRWIEYKRNQPAESHHWSIGVSYPNFNDPYSSDGSDKDQFVMRAIVSVAAINDPPVAVDDAYATSEDTTPNVAAPGVLANDTDADGDTLTANLVSTTSHGTLTLNSDGSFVYIPDANYYGTDSFTYLANDGHDDSNVATVTISVTEESSNFGLNSGDRIWNQSADIINAMRFQNTAGTGTLTKLEILIDDTTPNGKVRLGVYADQNGAPGSLLLDAGELPVTNGWISFNALDLPVTQNTYYWLVFNMQDANVVRYQRGQPSNSHHWGSSAYGALPRTFPTSGAGANNNQFVMRATVVIGP